MIPLFVFSLFPCWELEGKGYNMLIQSVNKVCFHISLGFVEPRRVPTKKRPTTEYFDSVPAKKGIIESSDKQQKVSLSIISVL